MNENGNENGNDKVESLKLFQTLTEAVGARATLQAMLGNLNNEELNRYLKACYGFTTLMTTDAACELLKRFKAAKKNKKAFRKNGYCGFRNFDKMCPALTGYSSKQIRNYAAGYKTPPKAAKSVVHLTTDEIKAREARQKVQAGIDATAAENRLARLQKTEAKNNPAREAVVKEAAIVVANPNRDVVAENPVAAKTQRLYEEAVSIIRDLLDVIPVGGLDVIEKASRKRATDFLNNNCGGINSVPLKSAKDRADGATAGREKLPASVDPRAVKNEPSQAAPYESAFDPSDPAANKAQGLIHGRGRSENSKGTGVEIDLMSGEVFENTKRSSHQVA